MFRARQPGTLPQSVVDAGKADGFVHICDQSALMFGSDRRDPTAYRPVVAIRKDGSRVVILPCTSKNSSDSPDLFELDEQCVMWTQSPEGRRTFAHYRYEVVGNDHLRGKIGVMNQPGRIALLQWLNSRY